MTCQVPNGGWYLGRKDNESLAEIVDLKSRADAAYRLNSIREHDIKVYKEKLLSGAPMLNARHQQGYDEFTRATQPSVEFAQDEYDRRLERQQREDTTGRSSGQ